MSAVLDPVARREGERFLFDSSDARCSRIAIQLDAKHVDAIEALSEEERCPFEEVKMLYAATLRQLMDGARIEDYLIVLTCKRVRNMLRQSRKAASLPAAAAAESIVHRLTLRAPSAHR